MNSRRDKENSAPMGKGSSKSARAPSPEKSMVEKALLLVSRVETTSTSEKDQNSTGTTSSTSITTSNPPAQALSTAENLSSSTKNIPSTTKDIPSTAKDLPKRSATAPKSTEMTPSTKADVPKMEAKPPDLEKGAPKQTPSLTEAKIEPAPSLFRKSPAPDKREVGAIVKPHSRA